MTNSDKKRAPVKRVPNKDLKCLDFGCDEHVYATFLCRKHYESRRSKEVSARRKLDRLVRKEAQREKKNRDLAERGTVCQITTCNALTLQESGLCLTHKNRAHLWQFAPEALIEVYKNPRCEICGSGNFLVMDHEHGRACEAAHRGKNGCPRCFRGLLCNGCNSGLGYFEDDRARMWAAISYLNEKAQETPR